MNTPKPGKAKRQVAALPWRDGEAGLEVLLVTSRETRRWVIPKGWPMKGKSDRAAAAQEAREEAGVEGETGKDPLGRYAYLKKLKRGEDLPCQVDVFALKVLKQRKSWPEKTQREQAWMTPEAAAAAVNEPELKALIEGFAWARRNGGAT